MSFYSLIHPSITRNITLIEGYFYSGGDANELENGLTPLEQVFLFFDYDPTFSFKVVNVLLENGANPNRFGKIPPIISAIQLLGNSNIDRKMVFDIVSFFLSKNANPNIEYQGRLEMKNPLIYAIEGSDDEIASLLLKNGAKQNISEKYIQLAEYENLSKFLFIIKKGESNVKNNLLETKEKIEQNNETITDIDGNEYHIITIGKQVWMEENLKVTKLNDGTLIPYCNDRILGIFPYRKKWGKLSIPAYCYYEHKTSNYKLYGCLYNWYAVNTGKLAPKGWHVPTDEEWDELENYLIANGYNFDDATTGNKIAKSLADTTNWQTDTELGCIGNDLTKNNLTGYSALPGGYRNGYDNCVFRSGGNGCIWWSASKYNASTFYSNATSAWFRSLNFKSCEIGRMKDTISAGFSVRCLRD